MALRKTYNRKIAGDMRGKITSGNRGKGDKERPESRPFFNVAEFPEIVEVYGQGPTEMAIMFPSNNLMDFYSEAFELWGSKGKKAICKRRCDGEEALDPITGEVKDCYCESLEKDLRCKFVLRLNAFILNPRNGKIINGICTRFESHSENSADNIRSELEKTFMLTGGHFLGVPFNLHCKMVEQPTAKYTKKYPLWELQAIGTVQQINQLAGKGVIPTNDMHALTIGETMHMPELPEAVTGKAIEAPGRNVEVMTIEEIKDKYPPANVSKPGAGDFEPPPVASKPAEPPIEPPAQPDASESENGFAEMARTKLYNRLLGPLSAFNIDQDDKRLKMLLLADKKPDQKMILASNFLLWATNGNIDAVEDLIPVISKGRGKDDFLKDTVAFKTLTTAAQEDTLLAPDLKMIDRVYKKSKAELEKWLDTGEGK